jgi:HK97 family phage portal protein
MDSVTGRPRVTPEYALRISAVLACVRVIAESGSTLPVNLYKRNPDGTKEKASDSYINKVLHDSPNNWQTSVEFYDQMFNYLLLNGNSLHKIEANSSSPVASLRPINPLRVKKVSLLSDGRKRFFLDDDETLDSHEVLHVMGMSLDGLWGTSVLSYARDSLGISLGAESMGLQLFENGLRPSGVLEHPENLSDDAIERLRRQIGEVHGGKFHKPMVLEEGMKWSQLSVTPEDAQFLETRKFQVEEICRIFRVPLHMVQSLERATFNNIEHMSMQFVTHTLRPWLVRVEKSMKRDLLYQDKFYVEFLTEGLLRGDTKSRYEAYASAIQNEWMSSDEVRAIENLNPREDGEGGEYKNPSINPKDKEKAADPEGEGEAVAYAFAEDIAVSIARREEAQLDKRSAGASQDPAKFKEWAAEWYSGHAEWTDARINTFCEVTGVQDIDRTGLVQAITAGAVKSMANAEDLGKWVEERKSCVYETVSNEIKKVIK